MRISSELFKKKKEEEIIKRENDLATTMRTQLVQTHDVNRC